MRFLIDAQLPRALAYALTDLGHVASHALLLPNGNATTDRKIAEFADLDDRILISKDSDFLDGQLLQGSPRQLLLVSTGNIPNRELLPLILRNLGRVEAAFVESDLVEITRERLIVR